MIDFSSEKNFSKEVLARTPCFIDKFIKVCNLFPLNDFEGGIQIQGAWNLALVLEVIQPKYYVELGVYKGGSSWFVSKLFKDKFQILCFDPRVEKIENLIPLELSHASYSSADFSTPVYQKLLADDGVKICFADDHQDVFERLLILSARNFDYVIFDDDYQSRADHRSFYMLLEQSKTDAKLKMLLELLVDAHIILPNLTAWNDLYPKTKLISETDVSKHYRPMRLVKLKNKYSSGWTAGSIERNKNRISQKIYEK